MFPEFRDLISELIHHDMQFKHWYEMHNALEDKIKRMKTDIKHHTYADIERLEREKLFLKYQLYTHLKMVSEK